MNNFGQYLTPEEAYELQPQITLKRYKELAAKHKMCECCGVEKAWKLADTGMCFSCTTGESDASDDYELIGG